MEGHNLANKNVFLFFSREEEEDLRGVTSLCSGTDRDPAEKFSHLEPVERIFFPFSDFFFFFFFFPSCVCVCGNLIAGMIKNSFLRDDVI